MNPLVYLDHAATTPVRDEVMAAMAPFFGPQFGNPSSVHRWGREARVALDEARERLADCLGAHHDEVCFTSGGTEGDNLAVLGVSRTLRAIGRTVAITTPVEHKAVLEAVHQVTREGGEERLLRVTADGIVDREDYAHRLDARAAIVSVMWVNNETGVVQDVPALAADAKAAGVVFHTDAVQAFGKVDINAKATPFDLLTISGHKIGAPKGIGALFIRRDTPLAPMLHGGSQDRGRRPGTENVAFAIGLATAAELIIAEQATEGARVRTLRDTLEARLRECIPDLVIHGAGAPRASHISNVSIPGTDSESMLMALDMRGIACSGGSACQSGSVSASHVLSAMGVPPAVAGAAIRMSLGALSDATSVERVVIVLATLAGKARGAFPAFD
ncbi:MAG: cysteine desulfurase [Gemmatimonadaceae bacterium]|nr:cysteine desulfurase [Gemmatimonadaceae bacterium]